MSTQVPKTAVLWRQPATHAAERLDVPAVGVYRVRDARIAETGMSYFDLTALLGFLQRAGRLGARAGELGGTSEPARSRITIERTLARRWNAREDAAGFLPILSALALWALVMSGVVAPLGDTLALLDAARPPVASRSACAASDGALSSAGGASTCP